MRLPATTPVCEYCLRGYKRNLSKEVFWHFSPGVGDVVRCKDQSTPLNFELIVADK